jgi:cytochrome c biogenesis protein CcdA
MRGPGDDGDEGDDVVKLARLSLFYAASYLLPAGLLLVVAPRVAFTMLLSTQPDAYGDTIPRMAGAVTVALGVLVVQAIRHRLDALYPTLVGSVFSSSRSGCGSICGPTTGSSSSSRSWSRSGCY